MLIKVPNQRDLKYEKLNINNLYSAWWTKFYKKLVSNNTLSKTNDDYTLYSQKHLYTSNGKSPDNNITVPQRNGMQAFKDSDSNASEYFNDKILQNANSLLINGNTLNDYYNIIIQEKFNAIKSNELVSFCKELLRLHNLLEKYRFAEKIPQQYRDAGAREIANGVKNIYF